MEYNIQAKPCTYNGINFKSRLEARWAYFFDETGWEWEYEPFEIEGKYPDFIIKCYSKAYKSNSIIVEVKPSVYLTKDFIYSRFES